MQIVKILTATIKKANKRRAPTLFEPLLQFQGGRDPQTSRKSHSVYREINLQMAYLYLSLHIKLR